MNHTSEDLLTWSRAFPDLAGNADFPTEFESCTMDPHLSVWLYILIALLHFVCPAACIRVCGPTLADTLSTVCAERGYYGSGSAVVSRRAAASFLTASSSTAHHRQKRRPRTGRIVNECCHNECTISMMESYCIKPRVVTTAPAAPTSRAEDAVPTSRGEDTAPTNRGEETAPEATVTTGLEQTPSERENKTEKGRRKDCNMRDESSTTSGKKKGLLNGLSKEERRRINSAERRASRECKKELSREKRRKAKAKRKREKEKGKTKKKRLESAERSRGTDRGGLTEDTTLLERGPLGIDERRTEIRKPKSSREQTSTATHTLGDTTTSRRNGKRTQSRRNSREQGRLSRGQEEPRQRRRRRRNVLQRIADTFL